MMNDQQQNQILKIYAELGQNFNGYYQVSDHFENLLTGQSGEVFLNNQFVTVRQKHKDQKISVARWRVNAKQLRAIPGAVSVNLIGDLADSNDQAFDFFLPTDLFDVYPNVVRALGTYEEMYEGIMSPSGRSIWIFCQGKPPLCLKIDTFNLDETKNFNFRKLEWVHAQQSIILHDFFKNEENIFSETDAICIEFEAEIMPSKQTVYNYLVRRLDFEKTKINSKDFLIPLNALVASAFGSDKQLRSIMGLQKVTPADFFENEFAKELAVVLQRALTGTFLHYEVHQQNLTAHMRQGKLVKLLYHDLLDTVFDPVSFFLFHFIKHGKTSTAAASILKQMRRLQSNSFFNSHATLQLPKNRGFSFTVSSFYRRYIRNFGEYGKIYNLYRGLDYFDIHSFEKIILRNLGWTAKDLALDQVGSENIQFLKEDLFWCIDRFHQVQQRRFIENSWSALHGLCEEVLTVLLEQEIKQDWETSLVCTSNEFPNDIRNIDFKLISDLRVGFDRSLFVGRYDAIPFILIRHRPE